MSNLIEHIDMVSDKETFCLFVKKLIIDYKNKYHEWQNVTIDEYLESMMSWIEDYSNSEFNDIDWDNIDYATIAKILYMGKIYE